MTYPIKYAFQTKHNMHAFNFITRKNESKILAKDISHECKCKCDGQKCNSNQKWNNDKC